MRNFLFLLFIAILTILVLLFITNPGLLDNIWLWLIGFAGGIIGFFRNIYDQFLQFIHKSEKAELAVATAKVKAENLSSASNSEIIKAQNVTSQKIDSLVQKIEDKQTIKTLNTPFDGTTLTVLRYIDDGETTLGLLFFRDTFFAYSLEDTFREVKIKGQTRIPAGEYKIDFNRELTGLTQKYKAKYSWFTYHLEIKNVQDFTGVYIHIGNDKEDTAGCLLIADGINASSPQKTLLYSTQAYERFYRLLKDLLESGEKVRIVIHDENWFKKINLQNI